MRRYWKNYLLLECHLLFSIFAVFLTGQWNHPQKRKLFPSWGDQMNGRTHGVGPNPPGDAGWGPLHEAGGDTGPLAPLFLCPTPPGRNSSFTAEYAASSSPWPESLSSCCRKNIFWELSVGEPATCCLYFQLITELAKVHQTLRWHSSGVAHTYTATYTQQQTTNKLQTLCCVMSWMQCRQICSAVNSTGFKLVH